MKLVTSEIERNPIFRHTNTIQSLEENSDANFVIPISNQ